MVHNGGYNHGLFRGVIMVGPSDLLSFNLSTFVEQQSGYTSPITSISKGKHQGFYDYLLEQTNCSSGHNWHTRLDCLRHADYNVLKAAIDSTPSLFSDRGLNLTWGPSFGGGFLTESLKTSIRKGRYAKVPILAGDVDDEGTIFSVALLSITQVPNVMERRTKQLTGHPFTARTTDSWISCANCEYFSFPTCHHAYLKYCPFQLVWRS